MTATLFSAEPGLGSPGLFEPGYSLVSVYVEAEVMTLNRDVREDEMLPGETSVKDPQAVLDWVFDWDEWLMASETISSSTMTISAGITLDSSQFTAFTATAWVSGGAPGGRYTLANRITTNQGRTDERSITIRVTDR